MDLPAFASCICQTLLTSRHTHQISECTDCHTLFQSQINCLIDITYRCDTDRTPGTRDQFYLLWKKFADTQTEDFMCMCPAHFHNPYCRTVVSLYDLSCRFLFFTHYRSSSINCSVSLSSSSVIFAMAIPACTIT